MSFPRYPKYKDSGVEWLGEVPEHWEVKRLKKIAPSMTVGIVVNPSSFLADEGAPFIYGGDIREGLIDWENSRRISEESSKIHSKTLLTTGDLLTVRVGAPGVTAVVPPECEGGNCASVMLIRKGAFDSRWLCYAMNTRIVRYQVEVVQYGAAQEQFNISHAVNFVVPTPPVEEQRGVALFLDAETAKIDELVAEQRRLIELLKEKRQAVISHAVTKGLNPNVPLRPSGIEWLGDVPEHWEVTVIKRFSTLHRGHDLTDVERTEGPFPVVTSGGISGTHGAFMAHGPGVVTGRYGSTGRLFYIEQNYWPHNTSLYVSDFHSNLPRFVWYSLQTVDFAAHSAKAAVPGIDRNDIHVLPVAVPPVTEQIEIVQYLEQATEKLDTLTAEAERGIDLLQERRTALISAAVTGKIDVRGFAYPAS